MARNDCDRVDALLDRIALREQTMTESERLFVDEHTHRCGRCAAVRALQTELGALDERGMECLRGDSDPEEWARRIVSFGSEATRRRAGARRRVWLAVALIGLMVPITVWASIWMGSDAEPEPPAGSPHIGSLETEAESRPPEHPTALAAQEAAEPITEQPTSSSQTPPDEPGTPLDAASDREEPVQVEAPPPTIEELLARAVHHRSQGRWAEAIETYDLLADAYPDSPEAGMCPVLIGQVQLDHRGRADLALVSFERYLRDSPSGTLLEEADWGIAASLVEIGDVEAEREALRRFLDRHPDSLHARQAEARLAEEGAP